jgi:hypothetical protein
MKIPLPDFFRNYGEILGEDGATFRVFATLAGLVLLLFAWFIVGALFQGIGRWWKRSHGDSRPRPSAP